MFCPACGKQISDESKYCQHCGSSIASPISSPRNTKNVEYAKPEIRTVNVSFRCPDGTYPTFSVKEKSGFWLGIESKKGRWNPPHINKEYLEKQIIVEINKWLAEGWELVEQDIEKMFVTKYESGESAGSKLGSALGLPTSLVWDKHWIFMGAKFHIRRGGALE